MREAFIIDDQSGLDEIEAYSEIIDKAHEAFTGASAMTGNFSSTFVSVLRGKPGIGVNYACQVVVKDTRCLIEVEQATLVLAHVTLADGRVISLLHNKIGDEEQSKVQSDKIEQIIVTIFGRIMMSLRPELMAR